jgi:hypothetical protein
MLKMMAHENMEEWGTSAIVEIETIAAVVEAYAEGKIELNGLSKDTPKALVRYAPSFIPERSPLRGERSYTYQSVANFLGWTKAKTGAPQAKVGASLNALQLIEEDILTLSDFEGLKTKEAEELVRETRARKEQREAEAKEADIRAREAEKRAKEAESYQARKVAEEQHAYHAEQASKKRRKAKEEASKVGHHLSRGIKEGRIATKDIRKQAEGQVGLERKERQLRNINSAARDLIRKLDELLDSDKLAFRIKALLGDVERIDEGLRDVIVKSFGNLIKRAEAFSNRFEHESELKNVTAERKLLKDG